MLPAAAAAGVGSGVWWRNSSGLRRGPAGRHSLADASRGMAGVAGLPTDEESQLQLSMHVKAMQANLEFRMPLAPTLPASAALYELECGIEGCMEVSAEKAAETWEGHCAPEQLEFLRHFVASRFAGRSKPLRMCQVGFNAGHSAVALLEHAPAGSILLSLDLAKHSYTRPLEQIVQGIAAERGSKHVMLVGDSAELLPKFLNIPFDLVFVDGNHAFEAVTLDIWHCLMLASPETVLLINHIYTDMVEGVGPTRAWLDAVCRGHVEQRAWHSCCSRHGIAVGASTMPKGEQ